MSDNNMNTTENMNYNQGMNGAPNMNYNQGINGAPNMNYNQGMNGAPNMNYNQGMNGAPNMNYNQGMNGVPNMNYNQGMNNMPNMNYQQPYMNNQYYYQKYNEQTLEKCKHDPVVMNFQKISFVAKIVALIVGFLLYKNYSSFTFPLSVLIVSGYLLFENYVVKLKTKPMGYFYLVSMVGISFSTMFTTDGFIQFFNLVAVLCLMICFYLSSRFDDKKWDLGFYIGKFIEQSICSITCIDDVFKNKKIERIIKGDEVKEKKKMSQTAKNVIIGLIVSVPIAAVALTLLYNADEVYKEIIGKIINIDAIVEFVEFVFDNMLGIFIFFCMIYIFLLANRCYLFKNRILDKQYESKKYNSVIGTVISIVLNVLYISFSFIQLRYLFFGSDGDKLPINTTYAEYARNGFATLMVLAVLNLLYVLIFLYVFDNSIGIKITLLLITLNTYVMIASSAMRTLLYIKYKYLTYSRIVVFLVLAVVALAFVGVIVRMFYKEFPLFKYCVVISTICWMLFAYIRPDYIIAKVNYDNSFKETQYDFFKDTDLFDDYAYFGELSLDAFDVLTGDLEDDDFQEVLDNYSQYNVIYFDFGKEDISGMNDRQKQMIIAGEYLEGIIPIYEKEDFKWFRWNLSRFKAKKSIYDAI